jgi:hypothetical protein
MSTPNRHSIEFFLDLIRRSGLVPDGIVGELVDRFQHSAYFRARLPESIAAFCSFLVAENVLTTWQCAKLREWRFRGFILGDWTLLDEIGRESTARVFLARKSHVTDKAILRIWPPIGRFGPRLEVVRQID